MYGYENIKDIGFLLMVVINQGISVQIHTPDSAMHFYDDGVKPYHEGQNCGPLYII